MSSLKEKIYDKMKTHTLASFATVTEDGKPWTRYVVASSDEQLNIWFATFRNSRKTQQINNNPEVHLTLGVENPQTAVSWLQVQGRAELLDDAETRNAVWFDHLSSIFNGPDDPNYVVCKVTPYRIEYFMMNMPKPEVWEAD
ncbi:MAG: pyridoxamine 5'-phosphate oxidase family protein [Desulfobacterales bacterium]|nr:pyridoxamine 5'-phosphate oxidase family protein [Desulfobacterales bacterium]